MSSITLVSLSKISIKNVELRVKFANPTVNWVLNTTIVSMSTFSIDTLVSRGSCMVRYWNKAADRTVLDTRHVSPKDIQSLTVMIKTT